MIKNKKGICLDCGKDTYLIAGRCKYCYWKHRNKVKADKLKSKGKSTSDQKQAMLSAWEKSDKKSSISGRSLMQFYLDYISNKPNHKFFWCFAHYLSKGVYTNLRDKEEGFAIVHPDEHELIDFGTEDKRKAYEDKHNCSFNEFYLKKSEIKLAYQ